MPTVPKQRVPTVGGLEVAATATERDHRFVGLDGSADERHSGFGRELGPLRYGLVERRVGDAVQHDTERGLRGVLDHEHDRAEEVRVEERRGGDEQSSCGRRHRGGSRRRYVRPTAPAPPAAPKSMIAKPSGSSRRRADGVLVAVVEVVAGDPVDEEAHRIELALVGEPGEHERKPVRTDRRGASHQPEVQVRERAVAAVAERARALRAAGPGHPTATVRDPGCRLP